MARKPILRSHTILKQIQKEKSDGAIKGRTKSRASMNAYILCRKKIDVSLQDYPAFNTKEKKRWFHSWGVRGLISLFSSLEMWRQRGYAMHSTKASANSLKNRKR
jgi:hypothetical protein